MEYRGYLDIALELVRKQDSVRITAASMGFTISNTALSYHSNYMAAKLIHIQSRVSQGIVKL